MNQMISSIFLLGLCVQVHGQIQSVPELVTEVNHPYFGSLVWPLASSNEDVSQNELGSIFRVYTQRPALMPDHPDALPPVMGQYIVKDRALFFQPRFPFIKGRSYWIWYKDISGGKRDGKIREIKVPADPSLAPPSVLNVYPSSSVWPANQLKFYIYFDQPMRTGFSLKAIELIDESGKAVKMPFLNMGEELWDAEQKRLTVWFDPGRIKSLLIPNLENGPPLHPDKTYRLLIKKEWMGANGLGLKADFIKVFRTVAKDVSLPGPSAWEISAPAANTLAPLSIYFPEPMDMALLQSGIGVLDQDQELVAGEIRIGDTETSWHWHPEKPWSAGRYILRVSEDLEDLAGNNLKRLFDEPHPGSKPVTSRPSYIDLIVKIEH